MVISAEERQKELDEIKALDLVSYLGSIGILPDKIIGNNFWYHSPFRAEKTTSFKINRSRNIWIDFGEYRDSDKFMGGSIVDFCMHYHRWKFDDFCRQFKLNTVSPVEKHANIKVFGEEREHHNNISQVSGLRSPDLLFYLQDRNIDLEIARRHCREVRYEYKGNSYYAIGFQNDLGGYELRNKYYKTATLPKDVTIINNSDRNKEVLVFEGFTDYLTFLTIHKNKPLNTKNYIILNGAQMLNRGREFMERHDLVRLYLDNDATGRKYTEIAKKFDPQRYVDESHLYRPHKDLNEWSVNYRNSNVKIIDIRPRMRIAK